MITTITLSTLALCGCLLSAPGNDSLLLEPPTSAFPLPPSAQQTSTQSKSPEHSALQDAKKRNALSKRAAQSRMRSSNSYDLRNNSRGQYVMPTAPTDSGADSQGEQYYQWLPPTAEASEAGRGNTYSGRPSSLLGPTGIPTSPTRARPGISQSYASRQNAQLQAQRMAAARHATATTTQSTPKPYTGVRQLSSGASPYLNLFRSGTSSGTIDNYSTLVKPALEQQSTNQQFGADIHSLENSTHVQKLNILRLDRETQNLHGVPATQYFMNYGDYYPNAAH